MKFDPPTSWKERRHLIDSDRSETKRDKWLKDNHNRFTSLSQTLPANGMILIPNKERSKKDPLYWAGRIDVLSKEQMVEIMESWEAAENQEIRASGSCGGEKARHAVEASPVYHFVRWERQGNEACVSQDLRQNIGPKGTIAARRGSVLEFLAVLDRIIGRKIRSKISELDPETAKIMAGASKLGEVDMKEITAEELSLVKEKVKGGDPLRNGSLGTGIVVTRGQGDKFHLDPGDSSDTYTVVIPVAPDGWGDDDEMTGIMELPQLGARIPVRPGQALFFRSGCLLHRATELKEDQRNKRLVITVFTDRYLEKSVMSRKRKRGD